MTDIVDSATRSRMMAGIGRKDTRPERLVRSYLHRAGLRFRVHGKGLPGTPDLVLPRYRSVVFVHGCFWHRHLGCHLATNPSTRPEFWAAKFRANVLRDQRQSALLTASGWHVHVIYECEAEDVHALESLFFSIVATGAACDLPT